MSLRIYDLQLMRLSESPNDLFCAFQRGPYQGWWVRRLLFPYLSCWVHHGWHLPSLGLFMFKICVSKNLDFWKILVLSSVLEDNFWLLNVSEIFERGYEMVWWNLLALSALLGMITHKDILRGLPLIYGLLHSFVRYCLMALWWYHLDPVVTFGKGLRNIWRDCFAMAWDVLRSILPAFLFHISATKKVSMGYLTWFLVGLLW